MILDECVRLGQPIPDKILNAPTIPEFMRLYVDAFFELTTDRQLGFGEGPIPYSSISAYCYRLDMSYVEELDFTYFIRLMDAVYLKHQSAKSKPKKAKKR